MNIHKNKKQLFITNQHNNNSAIFDKSIVYIGNIENVINKQEYNLEVLNRLKNIPIDEEFFNNKKENFNNKFKFNRFLNTKEKEL